MNSPPTVDDMMVAYAQDAIDYAAQRFNVQLDYSEASVERVEAILAQLFETVPQGFFAKLFKKGPAPEQIDQMAMILGGYVGEVMKRNWCGHWKQESKAFPGRRVFTLEFASGGDVWPHLKVGKRLTKGPGDNVWHYFQTLRERYVKPRVVA